MKICEPQPEDWPGIRDLTASFNLDYDGMEEDRFWIAREGELVAGTVGLKRHSDCLELVSLSVDPAFRARGLGRLLVEALMSAASGDVYLATVIPNYFRQCGFAPSDRVPAGMVKPPGWCDGCPKDLCTVMVRTAR
jgi:N-acetylglutamate synthase-like GNAT family acetyltransferase